MAQLGEGTGRGGEERSTEIWSDEFTGYVHLQPEQHFFDQPPFGEFIAEATTSGNVDRDRIISALIRISSNRAFRDPQTEQLVLGRYIENPRVTRPLFPEREGNDDEAAALANVLGSLNGLPKINGSSSWITYLKTKLVGNDFYGSTGEYTPPRMGVPVLGLSYFAWLEKTLERNERIKMLEARSAALDAAQLATAQTVADAIPSGHPVRRVWKFREGIGTVRERRGR